MAHVKAAPARFTSFTCLLTLLLALTSTAAALWPRDWHIAVRQDQTDQLAEPTSTKTNADGQVTPAPSYSSSSLSPEETSTLVSVILKEASVSVEVAAATEIPSIPVPPGDKYDFIRALADAASNGRVNGQPGQETYEQFEKRDAETFDLEALLKNIRPPPARLAAVNETFGPRRRQQTGYRVMCVGDSMTHGAPGDYTWRYRIWEWFRGQGIPFQLVGPYKGTQDADSPKPPQPPTLYGTKETSGPVRDAGPYATDAHADFKANPWHFSVWGRAVATDKFLIEDVLRNNPADILLVALGFNDLGWFYSNPTGTLQSMSDFVTNARKANPKIKIVIANVPQRTTLNRKDLPANTDAYNDILAKNIPRWSSSSSPITIARFRENYSCELDRCPAAYDGLHPNALGDYQIARAFAQGLMQMGIGERELVVPGNVPERVVSVPQNLRVSSSPQGVTALWDAVLGSGYEVQTRISGFTEFATPGRSGANRWDSQWAFEGLTYEIRVRSVYGDRRSDWTGVSGAKSTPQTPTPPNNFQARPVDGGIQATWEAPTGPRTGNIKLYNLIYFDQDTRCIFLGGAAFQGASGRVNGLTNGNRYLVALAAWNENGEGFPFVGKDVRVGRSKPAAPSGLKVVSTDETTAQLTWPNDPNAAGWAVWIRNAADNKPLERFTTKALPCDYQIYLFPGVQNYEFCISAYNGYDETAPSSCVRAGLPPSPRPPPAYCPPLPEWCPAGAQDGTWGPEPEKVDPNYTTGTNNGGGGGTAPSGKGASDIGDDDEYALDNNDVIINGCQAKDAPPDFDALDRNWANYPTQCRTAWGMKLLANMITSALATSKRLADSGFDEKFKYYVQSIVDSAPATFDEYMLRKGGYDYFECTTKQAGKQVYQGTCFKDTRSYGGEVETTYRLVDEPTWKRRLVDDFGLQPEWIEFVRIDPKRPCDVRGSGGACNYYTSINIPQLIKDKIKVANPREVIDQVRPKITNLQWLITGTFMDMRIGNLNADYGEALTASALPAFMVRDLADYMQSAYDIGQEYKEAKKKELIFFILGLIFMAIPFAGQAIGTAFRAGSRIAFASGLVAETGNAAVAVASIVDDPESAPWVILELLLGAAGGSSSRTKFASGARASALLGQGITKFSSKTQVNTATVAKVVKHCLKR